MPKIAEGQVSKLSRSIRQQVLPLGTYLQVILNFLFELAEDGNLESNLKEPAPACSAPLCIVGLQDPNNFNHTRSEAVVHEGSVQKLYALGDLCRYLREGDRLSCHLH